MDESRKQEVARKYIEENVLNKKLSTLKDDITQSLENLKDIVSIDSKKEESKVDFGVDKFMDILFNKDGKQRNRISYEFNKLKTITYYTTSSEGREYLDILYTELQKAKSKEELENSLAKEISNLEDEVLINVKGNNINVSEDKENIEDLSIDEKYIYEKAKEYGITNNSQIAYILATVKGESNFKNIKEIDGENKSYGKDGYYGRGFVQITLKDNYKKFTDIIKDSGLRFKDNTGKPINDSDLDLVQNPDTILKSNDLAVFILVYGMKNGSFTGKKLSDFINDKKTDFYNARSIINGMSSAPKQYENNAKIYLDKINSKEF